MAPKTLSDQIQNGNMGFYVQFNTFIKIIAKHMTRFNYLTFADGLTIYVADYNYVRARVYASRQLHIYRLREYVSRQKRRFVFTAVRAINRAENYCCGETIISTTL